MIAYLDPGTGSVMLQVIVGGFAGIAVFFKMFGRKLVFWKKTDSELTTGDTDDAAEDATSADAASAKSATVPPGKATS